MFKIWKIKHDLKINVLLYITSKAKSRLKILMQVQLTLLNHCKFFHPRWKYNSDSKFPQSFSILPIAFYVKNKNFLL